MFGVQLYWKAPVTHTHTHGLLWRQPTPLSRGRQRDGPHPKGRMVQIPQLIEKHRGVGQSEGTDVNSIRPSPHTHHLFCALSVGKTKRKEQKKCRKYWTFVGIVRVADNWILDWLFSNFLPCFVFFCALAVCTVTTAATVWLCRHWVTPLLSYAFKLDSLIQAAGVGRYLILYLTKPSKLGCSKAHTDSLIDCCIAKDNLNKVVYSRPWLSQRKLSHAAFISNIPTGVWSTHSEMILRLWQLKCCILTALNYFIIDCIVYIILIFGIIITFI